MKTVWQFLLKLNIYVPHDPVISPLVIYPREIKIDVYKETSNQAFMTPLFIIDKWENGLAML